MDSNIQVVVEVFSMMAAYFVQSCCACGSCTVQNVWFPFETRVDNLTQHVSSDTQFSSAFAKLWKKRLLASSCLSVHLSVRTEQFGYHGTDFHEIRNLNIF